MKPLLCCLILGGLGIIVVAKPPKTDDIPAGYHKYVKMYSDTAAHFRYLDTICRKNFCVSTDTTDMIPANQLDKPAEFPGGKMAMLSFIGKNIIYPNLAREMLREGRVLIKFLVDENGNICNPQVLRYAGYGMDEEALRTLVAMGRWVPAYKNGIAVKSYFILPVTFNLA